MYRPISDDAIIGDTQTVALISSQGSIDWACLPHFDSAATFLCLLADRKGGYCANQPSHVVSTTRRYVEGSNILETTFTTATGVLVATDFMPIQKHQSLHPVGQDVTSEHRIVRLPRCMGGSVECVLELEPTFAFAAEPTALVTSEDGAIVFQGRNDTLHGHCPSPWVQSAGQASATLQPRAGDIMPLVLMYAKLDADVTSFTMPRNERWMRRADTGRSGHRHARTKADIAKWFCGVRSC